MALVLTIAGVTKTLRGGSLNISDTANGHATASFEIDSVDSTYRPALDAEVLITESGTRIFGGLIGHPGEKGIAGPKTPGIVTNVTASDFNQYTDRRTVLAGGGFPAGQTLKQWLTSLLGYLSVYGVTLDAGQVNGPTMPQLICEYQTVTEILNQAMTLTAGVGAPYVWRIDNFKVLSAYQPSSAAAPFDVATGDGNAIGDIEVETSRDQYANRVIVKGAQQTQSLRVETFTGDGSTDTFTLQYTPTKTYGYVTYDAAAVPQVNETLTDTAHAGTATWTYDATTNTIKRETGAPPAAQSIAFMFDGTYSGIGDSQDAGYAAAPWDKFVPLNAVPDDTTVQAIADGYLAQMNVTPKTIKYRTRRSGLVPGMSQTISVAARNLSTSVVITEVVTTDIADQYLVREVTAVSGTVMQGGWRDVYVGWNTDKTGSSATSPVSTGTGSIVSAGGGAAPPDKAVQFNRAGTFGGDGDFTYDETTNSLVCGGGASSITAAVHESCYVFGYNCHITD